MSEKYNFVDKFNGYIRKQDITNVAPGFLVEGSQNVLTNEGERIASRKGYIKLETPETVYNGGIKSAFDWRTSYGEERHVRGWEARAVVLSVTTNTITKTGVTSFADAGFGATGTIWINGQAFTYSGGANTTTLTGVSPDPSVAGIVADDVILQGSLQFLDIAVPEWIDLAQNKKRGLFNFTTVWSDMEYKRFLRFVSGENNNVEWSGGMTTFASATASTITKQGSTPWKESSFYQFATQQGTITIVDYNGLSGDTVAINVNGTTTTLTEGVDWTASVDNNTTAASLEVAIEAITGLDASVVNNVITIDAQNGYSIRNITLSDSTNMTRTPDYFLLKQVIIGGITYTYNGGEDTNTLTGVTPNPTLGGHVAGDLVHQAVRTFTNAQVGLPTTYNNDLIATFRNQLYIASNNANTVYVSFADNFEDFTFTTPVREVGEGDLLTFGDSIRGLIPQDNSMYVFAGDDYIYNVKYELSADLQSESILVDQFNTAPLQGALTQSAIGKIKNSIVYVSNEKAFNQLGFIENIFPPQNVNISDPIKVEFEVLDFTNASVFYWDYNIYIALPQEDITLIYNLALSHWEAPQVLPVSVYSVINGQLYGHSSRIKQTYKMFTGWSDDGNPIAATALFSYQNYGIPANYKTFNEVFTEGYVSSNTDLDLIVRYEIDGCTTQVGRTLAGRNRRFVCIGGDDGSLGKQSLGKRSLAGRGKTIDDRRPPKFRWYPTFPHFDFYEVQFGFESDGVDQRWEILRFGANTSESSHLNVDKKD